MYTRNENSLPNGDQYYFSTTHCDSADCKTKVRHGAMPLALSWLALLIYGCCPENLCLGPKRCNGQLVFKHLTFCSHETAGIRHTYYWLVIWFPSLSVAKKMELTLALFLKQLGTSLESDVFM